MPRVLTDALSGHEVRTVQQMGWAGIDNGALLRLAVSAGFDALETMDRSIEFQHDVSRIGLGFVIVRARSIRVEHVLPLVADVLAALAKLRPGDVIHVSGR